MRPAYFVPTGKRLVALTFDDGPSPGVTDSLLGVLERKGARGTFFMVGVEAEKHPSMARDVARAGHEVGVHGNRHKKGMKFWTREAIFENFRVGKDVVSTATGVDPKWMRPPYGNVTTDIMDATVGLGMRYAGWSLNSEDWFTRSWVDTAARRTIPGTVLVLHDGGRVEPDRGKKAARQLGEYIGRLADLGYAFTTLGGLVCEWDANIQSTVGTRRLLGMRDVEEFGKRWATPMWDVDDLLGGVSFSVSAGGAPCPWSIPPMSDVETWIPRIEVEGQGTPFALVV